LAAGALLRNVVSARFSSSASRSRSLPVLTLYTKPVCPLCDEAKWQIQEAGLRDGQHFRWHVVDISQKGNEALFEQYKYDIPVFFLDQQLVCQNKIDLDKLKRALNVN